MVRRKWLSNVVPKLKQQMKMMLSNHVEGNTIRLRDRHRQGEKRSMLYIIAAVNEVAL